MTDGATVKVDCEKCSIFDGCCVDCVLVHDCILQGASCKKICSCEYANTVANKRMRRKK